MRYEQFRQVLSAFSVGGVLISEELLVEANQRGDTPLATLIFFAGCMVFWMIHVLGTR